MTQPRRGRVRAFLGTVAAVAGLNAGLVFGAVVGLLRRDRRFGVNAGISVGCDAAMALAGLKLSVIGEHNLWRRRPAVFVFNHRSALDAPILGALVRRDVTAVVKAEARYDPRMLIGGLLLDPAFVHRGDTAQARAELDKLVERIRSGTSIAIAPEGTRTATAVPERFKKGAFHLAMRAGVPMVPVVLRNAGELMGRSKLVRPGTVQVCVLDPIETADWTAEQLDRIADDVRQRFVDTLENWPGETEPGETGLPRGTGPLGETGLPGKTGPLGEDVG